MLDSIERAGNRLPDPITMFLGLAIIVAVISAICSAAGINAVNPADGSTIEIFNLLSFDGIRYLWTNVITNFAGFAPLGMVLVAVIGSSVAEKSGFLVSVMVNFLGKARGWIVTAVIMFDPNYEASIAINWYFLIVSCVVLTVVGTVLVEKVLLHRFPINKEELAKYDFDESASNLTDVQKKGIKAAGLSILIYIIVIVLMCVPVFGDRAILADENGSITSGGSAFSKGIVFTVTMFLMIPGIVYGVVIGRYKNDKDLWV